MSRIYLSPPLLSAADVQSVNDALHSGWVAPAGPDLDAFEAEFGRLIGTGHALALSSGTAALHLALRVAGVGPGDEVLVSTLTVAASVNPILYLGARPTFVDVSPETWTMDAGLLAETMARRAEAGRPPKAVVLVHLYGQCADIDPVRRACERHAVSLVEDAAEALGATYHGRPAGAFGRLAAFSLNGNKIVTSGGGGVLATADAGLAAHARKLANHAREPVLHYEHLESGYNYRLSNVLAGLGRSQLRQLSARVEARRRVFDWYVELLSDLPGVAFMPEAPYGRSTRWLSVLTVDPAAAGFTRDDAIAALERADVESRPVWKPMHRQPAYADFEAVGGAVSDDLFERGLCLPSGPGLSRSDVERVADIVRGAGTSR